MLPSAALPLLFFRFFQNEEGGASGAWSVTTIAFMGIVSSVICLFGGNVAAIESPFDIVRDFDWT